jgi:hypothetical protein
MKKYLFLILFLLQNITSYAHVGSAGVQMQAQAGAYKVLVSIMPPDVIPGTAQVSVYIENGEARKVTVRPIYFYSGDKGAPTSDPLLPVAGQNGQFQGAVWLMESGSSSAQITIDGNAERARDRFKHSRLAAFPADDHHHRRQCERWFTQTRQNTHCGTEKKTPDQYGHCYGGVRIDFVRRQQLVG